MQIRYTHYFLHKLENIISETGYILRYEKGSFKSGYCILNENKIAIINKFFSLEGKINSLLKILDTIVVDASKLSQQNRLLYFALLDKKI